MSLEEIASVMECPVKTVSSRLVTAREKIREAVLIYEKSQGDRLHAIVPVPILTVILRKEAETLTIPQIPMELSSNALMNAAANASASTLTTTATVAGHVSMQLYTLLQTHEPKYLRNLFFNFPCLRRSAHPLLLPAGSLQGRRGRFRWYQRSAHSRHFRLRCHTA